MDTKVTNYRAIARILGIIILIIGIAEIFPWIYAEVTGDSDVAIAFRICAPLTLALGLFMWVFIRSGRSRFGVPPRNKRFSEKRFHDIRQAPCAVLPTLFCPRTISCLYLLPQQLFFRSPQFRIFRIRSGLCLVGLVF